MRVKQLKLFKFEELSEESKEKAINSYRQSNDEIFWQDEIFDSLKKLIEVTDGVKLKDYSLGLNSYSYIKLTFSNEEVENLSGARALGWLENNLFCYLRMTRAEYLKNRKTNFNYGYRIGKIKDCPLTGYCADEDFLSALIDNVKSGMTLKEAFTSLADTYVKILENEYEHQNSDEFIIEHLSANDYEFLENGDRY